MNELLEMSYLWFMIKDVDGSTITREPNAKIFKRPVKEGKLKGETISSELFTPDTVICEPTDKITEFTDSYDDSGSCSVGNPR